MLENCRSHSGPCFPMLTSFRSVDFNSQKSQHWNIDLRILECGLHLSKLPCSEDPGVNITEIRDTDLAWGIVLYLFHSQGKYLQRMVFICMSLHSLLQENEYIQYGFQVNKRTKPVFAGSCSHFSSYTDGHFTMK